MTFDISKCKAFDLERALAGDKVVTRDGREVVQIFYADKACLSSKVIVVIDNHVSCYYSNGNYGSSNSDYDLLMAPVEPVVTRKYFELYYRSPAKLALYECEPDLENWYMYIEYHDGEPVNAVFAKDVK